MSARKEVKEIVLEAEQQGWRRVDKNNSVLLLSPDGTSKVTLHWSPSDHRWKKNALAALRQGGFENAPDPKGKGKGKGKGKA